MLAVATSLAAQAPTHISSNCTTEMVQELNLPCSASAPCPLFLELGGAATVASRIVVVGNVHTASATVESVLLISDDSGKTWTEPHPRIRGAVLDQVQFFDFETGWITGHLLQPNPKDAFVLVTSDGGRSWRKRNLFSEPRSGAVELFWFDSRSHGMLALDRGRGAEDGMRYELWESMTGGDSWSIRQVNNEPLTLKQPEPPGSTCRVRTGKVHVVECRTGDAWSPAAYFAVSAGQCKLEEPPAAPDAPFGIM